MVEESIFDAYEKVPGKKKGGVVRTFAWVEGTSL